MSVFLKLTNAVILVLILLVVRCVRDSIRAIKRRQPGEVRSRIEIWESMANGILYTSLIAGILLDNILVIVLSMVVAMLLLFPILLVGRKSKGESKSRA